MEENKKHGLLAIVDVIDYAAQSAQLGMSGTSAFDHAFEEAVHDLADEYKGEYIRRIGGEALVFFPVPEQFLDFAGALRELSKNRMLDNGEFFCDLNIVAHYGEFPFHHTARCHSVAELKNIPGFEVFGILNRPTILQAYETAVTEPLLEKLENSLANRGITPVRIESPHPGTAQGIVFYKLTFPSAPGH